MLVVRPGGPSDLDTLMELAVLSGRGFTSLPEHEPTLREPLEAWYTVFLEDTDTGEVAGVAGIKAGVGVKRPHFSFRVVTLAQSSPVLNLRFDHRALVLVNECSGWSEVGSLFLRPERRKGGAGRLLAQSRYMLIGLQPERFADTVLAELRGWFDDDGTCPFWENVATKFFRLPFDEADRMSASTDGQFILDLAPRHPIYVEILPSSAREAIGKVHREGQAALAMLEREGFRTTGLVDIFDGGPTVSCARDQITTIRNRVQKVAAIGSPEVFEDSLISSGNCESFRSVFAPVLIAGDQAIVSGDTAAALKVREGESLWVRM